MTAPTSPRSWSSRALIGATDDQDHGWVAICPYARLEPERGVAALVGGAQVAIFRLHDGRLFAIGNRDPIAGAYVMSRGIVGSRHDAPTVTSPLYKEAYDLRTGECLDRLGVTLPTFPVACRDGVVYIGPRGGG